MDLPDELTSAENQLKQIYLEYRTLKKEAQKEKEAAEAAAAKKRTSDAIAEDPSDVVKKLKSSGLLDKLHVDNAPKTAYKRSSTLEKRLHTQKLETPSDSPVIPISPPVSESRPGLSPSAFGLAPSQFGLSPSSFSTPFPQRRPFGRDPPESPASRPKSLYDSFISGEKDPRDKTPALEANNTNHHNNSYDTGPRHRGLGFQSNGPAFQPNGLRQKMIYVEADNVQEGFLRPLFEKFGPLIRITPVPEERHAFVLYRSFEDSQKAIQEMDGKTVDGIHLQVTIAQRRERPHSTSSHRPPEPATPPSVSKPDTRELVTYEEGELA